MHFAYKGRNEKGQLISGEMEAASVEAAAGQLLNLGVTPVSLEANDGESNSLSQLLEKLQQQKVKAPDLIMFCRQMYTITKSGIPLIRGVRGLAASIHHPLLRRTLDEVADELESGKGLSTAMSRHPKVFNSLFISIIHVGENSGRLEEAFLQLSQYLERDLETNKSIKAALRYPSFVITAIALAMVVINVKVIPAFAKMFAKFGAVSAITHQNIDRHIQYVRELLAPHAGSGSRCICGLAGISQNR